jgi:TRAP-type C4-dicarboxylate transport system substrate-binding protein
MADQFPRGHTCGSILAEAYIDRVQEMSDGDITIQYEDAGRLLKFSGMLSGGKEGIADIVNLIAGYISGDIPLIGVTLMPFVTSTVEGRLAFNWGLANEQPDVMAEFEKWKFKALYTWPVDDSYLHVKKPVAKLEDLSGRRIRTSGGIVDEALVAWGAVPVNIPSAETYTALQRGIVDGAIMHTSSFWGWKWYEQCKHTLVTPTTLNANCGWMGINSDKWAELPEWAQDILLEAGQEHMKYMSEAFPALSTELLTKLEGQGNVLIELNPGELERMAALTPPLIDKWVAENGAAGGRVWEYMKSYTGK